MTRRKKRRQKKLRDTELQEEAERRRKMCGDKKQYNSELEALAWGREANERYRERIVWKVYFCPYCQKWHLANDGEF